MSRSGRPALALLACLVAAAPASAATYRWVDARGVVNYADRPPGQSLLRDAVPVGADDDGPAGEEATPASAATEPSSPAPAPAGEPTPRAPREPPARELMRLSGLDDQVGVLADGAQAEVSGLLWRVGRRAAGQAAVLAFGPEKLRRHAEAAVASRLRHEHAGPALAWLRSPLARRITALELRALTPEWAEAQVLFVDTIPGAMPPPARIGLVHRLDRAGEITETSFAAVAAVRAAVGAVMAPERTGAGAGLEGPVRLPPAIDEAMRLRTVTGLLFAYRSVSDAELGRYVAFWESPSGRWLTRVLQGAVHDAIRAARAEAAVAAGHGSR